ncbi:MAG TPA: glycosyltransferase family 2 protein [Puia sp.]|nr:glycosyltransferase family 2 protein [Puia sp.]
MKKLSVVIISFNEEKNIGKCIESVKNLADEIIVLDSFSKDETVRLAREKGAIVYQQVFSGYGAQKNAAAALAGFDFVLFLDADEYPDDRLYRMIATEKQHGFPADGYIMNRLNNYCGQWIRHGSWYPDKKLRLINRQKGHWNNHLVHESIEMEKDTRIVYLEGNLLHSAYHSLEEHITKNNRYSSLSAQFLFEKGKRTNLFKIILNPFWAFVNSYLLRMGWMDGFNGFVIAINIAHLTFLKHTKLYQLRKTNSS